MCLGVGRGKKLLKSDLSVTGVYFTGSRLQLEVRPLLKFKSKNCFQIYLGEFPYSYDVPIQTKSKTDTL